VATLQASSSGRTVLPDAAVNHQEKTGVLFFYGYIRIPGDGNYTFYLTADTRTFLRVHDAQAIDEDFGYEGGTERKASMFLKAGLHPFRLYYICQEQGNPLLDFKWSGPGISKQNIPQNILFRKKEKKR
jgi:hypothetical protein